MIKCQIDGVILCNDRVAKRMSLLLIRLFRPAVSLTLSAFTNGYFGTRFVGSSWVSHESLTRYHIYPWEAHGRSMTSMGDP